MTADTDARAKGEALSQVHPCLGTSLHNFNSHTLTLESDTEITYHSTAHSDLGDWSGCKNSNFSLLRIFISCSSFALALPNTFVGGVVRRTRPEVRKGCKLEHTVKEL